MFTSTTILIAHSYPVVCAGLTATLSRVPDYRILDCAQVPDRTSGALRAAGVDLVIGDLQFISDLVNRTDGALACNALATPKLVMLTQREGNRSDHATELPTGVHGCLSIDCHEHGLLEMVRRLGKPASVSRRRGPARGGLAPSALRRVRECIDQRLAESLDVKVLADIAKLSACHFARAFKQSVGLPPHRYLIERRIEAAAELIRVSDRPLTEISLEVGFSDQSHFTRSFGRAREETPSAFRRRHR
jgi:AraC-like DNA-binding protein